MNGILTLLLSVLGLGASLLPKVSFHLFLFFRLFLFLFHAEAGAHEHARG